MSSQPQPNSTYEVRVIPPPDSPMDVARQFVEDKFTAPSGVPTLRAWRGGWWKWKAASWAEMDSADVRSLAYGYLETAVYLTEKGDAKPWSPSRNKVANLLEALQAVAHTVGATQMPAWLGGSSAVGADQLVACTNGLLHVPTRRLLPHDPLYFNQVSVPFPYQDNAPAPTGWLRFLDQLWPADPDSIAALQEFFGYVISGRTDLHKILLVVGPTRAGKGVIARVLKALVGRGNHAGPTLASLGTNFGLSPLIGKPLAIISDARLGNGNVHQVVERLLSISGEDMLTVDIKYREPWTGTLPTRFFVISNELPQFGDASGAIAYRFIVLVLTESWLGQENPNLTLELLEELPGIFGGALDGLERLNDRGRFTEPQSSVDALVALLDLVSPVAAFVRDRCRRGPFETAVDDVWSAWKAWCEDNGHRARTKQTFGRRGTRATACQRQRPGSCHAMARAPGQCKSY